MLMSVGSVGASEWEVRDSQTIKDINKTWTITFNKEVNKASIDNTSIYVESENDRLVNPVEIGSEPNKVIVKAPIGGYEIGETYTLYIKDIKSKDGETLTKSVKMDFTIQESLMEHKQKLVANGVGIHSKYVGQLSDDVKYLKIDMDPKSQYPNLTISFYESFNNRYFFDVPEQQEELEVSLAFTFLDAQHDTVGFDEQKLVFKKTNVYKSNNLREIPNGGSAKILLSNEKASVTFLASSDITNEGVFLQLI